MQPFRRDRWVLSGWSSVRPGGRADALSPQLGGTQSGMRGAWRVDRAGRLELYARLVGDGMPPRRADVAAGIAARPFARLPLQIAAERREPIAGRDGRSAFAAYAVGGVSEVAVAGAWRLDGYGAAGVVGLHRRDLFVEGWATLRRPVAGFGKVALSAGAGAWGAAQPGVARLDAGPGLSAVWRRRTVSPRLSLDWRQRIAGNAAPGSGPALTLGVDL